MQLLELTLPTPEENLALDEALVDLAESQGPIAEILRIWEPADWLVVLGRTSKRAVEVNLAHCQADNVPVLRRSSGGATIATGPGCLMYAVVLNYQQRPRLRLIDQVHRFVLGRMSKALLQFDPEVRCAGTSDLARGNQKFSGNSLRCKRDAFVYHGTIMYDLELLKIGRYLLNPPRQPEYRAARTHSEFVTNLPARREPLINAIAKAWNCDSVTQQWPRDRVRALVEQRYGCRDWHEER